jgi:hypothetical protein
MITLLNYLGDILKGLSVMLKALKSSIKFLIEALIIVGLYFLGLWVCSYFKDYSIIDVNLKMEMKLMVGFNVTLIHVQMV